LKRRHLTLAVVGMLLPAPVLAADDYRSDGDFAYVCGPVKPEDVLAIPGTPWLIASGFAPGAGLKLVDTATRTYTPWFTGRRDQVRLDRHGYPNCPGPLDPQLFNARGLSLRRVGDKWRLLAVNHGGRESIEAFDVTIGPGAPDLVWRGCVPMPTGQVGNSVASFADGTTLVTVLTRPGTTIADFVGGRRTGGVWEYRLGDVGFRLLPGTDLPGNNGLEVDPDQRHFYVVAFGWHSVLTFDRRDTSAPIAQVAAPDFMPDNIHWSGDRLLIAGMRLDEPACGGLRPIINGVADPMLCHRGWIVGELDRTAGRIRTVAYGRPQPGFNGLSAAAIVGDDLWLGSFQSSRLAIVSHFRASPEGRQQ
jgi:hypothetical protein